MCRWPPSVAKALVGIGSRVRPGAMPAATHVPRPWPAARTSSLTSRQQAPHQVARTEPAFPLEAGLPKLAEDVDARGPFEWHRDVPRPRVGAGRGTMRRTRAPCSGGPLPKHGCARPTPNDSSRPGTENPAPSRQAGAADHMNARWHHARSGFRPSGSTSSASEFTPRTMPSTRSLCAGIGAPTGSSKYMTLTTRR